MQTNALLCGIRPQSAYPGRTGNTVAVISYSLQSLFLCVQAVGQQPFAIVHGCSDSRVSAEMVFDQGLGDLFVIRVAGNIVAPSQVGSVEFAAARFGTRLVVVLGHTQCGIVMTTLEEIKRPTEDQSRNLRSIVDRIRPSLEELLDPDLRHDFNDLVRHAVRANIRASANHLRHGSQIIEQLIQKDDLIVVGAEYSLETGIVDFFYIPGVNSYNLITIL